MRVQPESDPLDRVMFVPANAHLRIIRPAMFQVYLKWRRDQSFIAKESSYLYDSHFQPGTVVQKHYRDWAVSRGLRIGTLRDIPEQYRDKV